MNRFLPTYLQSSRRGLSFLEIIIATLVIGAITIPIYSLFSTSRRMGATAKNMMGGMGCAVSYMSALRELDVELMTDLAMTRDLDLQGSLHPDNLQVRKCTDGFTRRVAITKGISKLGAGYALVKIEVDWNNPVTKQPQHYNLRTLLREK